MDHDVHVSHGLHEPLPVAHVAEEEAEALVGTGVAQLRLFQLVTRERHHPPRPVVETATDEGRPKRAGGPGDEDILAGKRRRWIRWMTERV
jgi:hypothetical protein